MYTFYVVVGLLVCEFWWVCLKRSRGDTSMGEAKLRESGLGRFRPESNRPKQRLEVVLRAARDLAHGCNSVFGLQDRRRLFGFISEAGWAKFFG